MWRAELERNESILRRSWVAATVFGSDKHHLREPGGAIGLQSGPTGCPKFVGTNFDPQASSGILPAVKLGLVAGADLCSVPFPPGPHVFVDVVHGCGKADLTLVRGGRIDAAFPPPPRQLVGHLLDPSKVIPDSRPPLVGLKLWQQPLPRVPGREHAVEAARSEGATRGGVHGKH